MTSRISSPYSSGTDSGLLVSHPGSFTVAEFLTSGQVPIQRRHGSCFPFLHLNHESHDQRNTEDSNDEKARSDPATVPRDHTSHLVTDKAREHLD